MIYDAFSEYYDMLITPVDYEARAKYFDALARRYVKLTEKPLLLDLGCGTGSLSIEMQRLGYDVIAVDASAGMLSKAGMKCAGSGILFLRQKFWNLDLYGTVEVAVCALDCLNHISSAALLRKTFERLALFVAPGGVLLFDVNTPYKHREILGNNTFVYDLAELFCVWQNVTDERLRTKITLDFFVREKEVYRRSGEQFIERAWTHEQLSRLLSETGFSVLDVFEGDTFEPVLENTQRAVYAARRNGG